MCCCTNKSEKFQGEAKDPACGMTVDPAKASASQYGGVTYSFCCEGCKRTFDGASHHYAAKASPVPVRS